VTSQVVGLSFSRHFGGRLIFIALLVSLRARSRKEMEHSVEALSL
jgi:hypothetical protein